MKSSKHLRLVGLALALVVLAAVVAFSAGCGGRSDESTTTASPSAGGTKVTTVVVITPEKANDYGWNQQGADAAKAAAASVGAECIVQDGAGYGDISPIMTQVANQYSPQLIFPWASGYNAVAPQMAQQLNIPVTAADPGTEEANVPGLVNAIETNGEQGGYLAGVLAASMTKTGTVGIVESAEDINWSKMSGGFIEAAKATKPDIKILFVQVGQAAYADAAAAKRVTANTIAAGADIILGMGDGSSFGMMQAVETTSPPSGADKVWFIDVIGDKSSLDKKQIYLSSIVWDFTEIDKGAIAAVEDGTFGTKSWYLNLTNGMSLLQTEYIPAETWTAVETAKQGIIDGSITVPVKTSFKEVKAML